MLSLVKTFISFSRDKLNRTSEKSFLIKPKVRYSMSNGGVNTEFLRVLKIYKVRPP